MTYTTQAQVRAAFWDAHDGMPHITRCKVNPHKRGSDYNADTRCAFVDYVDMLARNGDISDALAQRVTL
jgi:hypothetical protein